MGLRDWFFGRREDTPPAPPVLRNKPGGMAWIRNIRDVPGSEALNGRAVKTVALIEGRFWSVEPAQRYTATAMCLTHRDRLIMPGDSQLAVGVLDECLEPWKEDGVSDEEVRDLYAPTDHDALSDAIREMLLEPR